MPEMDRDLSKQRDVSTSTWKALSGVNMILYPPYRPRACVTLKKGVAAKTVGSTMARLYGLIPLTNAQS